MNENKNLIFTYIFSLIGGLFGLHHFYLERTQHALLWFTTCGGFGIGFIYEFLFLIKTYVDETNHDPLIINQYKLKMIQEKSPTFELNRLCGQYLTAIFYGFITYYAFPDTWHQKPLLLFFIGSCTTTAIAFGTYMVGTIGPRQCSFVWPLLGAIVGIPFLIWPSPLTPSFNISVILSSLLFEWKIEWNPRYFQNFSAAKSNQSQSTCSPKRKRQHFIKHCLLFGFGVIVFSAIFTSAIYQNLHVNINGRHIKIKDILNDFIKTQGFTGLYRKFWTFRFNYGFKGLWTQIWLTMKSENDRQAYETLNLRSDVSQNEIESQCRILARKWHPDRYQNFEEKQKATIIFMNIQQACNHLSHERQRRQLINKQ